MWNQPEFLESSVHLAVRDFCAQSSVRDTRPEDFVTQSLGCGGFSWFGEALCIVGLPKFAQSAVYFVLHRASYSCTELCAL